VCQLCLLITIHRHCSFVQLVVLGYHLIFDLFHLTGILGAQETMFFSNCVSCLLLLGAGECRYLCTLEYTLGCLPSDLGSDSLDPVCIKIEIKFPKQCCSIHFLCINPIIDLLILFEIYIVLFYMCHEEGPWSFVLLCASTAIH
jgi:hypothetical protein